MKSTFLLCDYLQTKWFQCVKQNSDLSCRIYVEEMKKNNCQGYGFTQHNEKEFLFLLWELLY